MTEEEPSTPYLPPDPRLSEPRAAGRAFDGLAPLYDRARPGYPGGIVSALVGGCRLDASSRLLEIGCGTGQLTRDLAPSGASICCVEPGAALSALARGNLARFSNVEVVTARFEDFEAAPGSFDAVVSATAFHWVDPAVSFAKAAHLLRAGGCLALLTNCHVAGGSHTDPRFAGPVRRLHERLAPELGTCSFPTAEKMARSVALGGDVAQLWSRVDRKTAEPPDVSALFAPPEVRAERWLARYSRDGYLGMLATQSSYALLEEGRRRELLYEIGRLVDVVLGGVVTKSYLALLATARRRPASDGERDAGEAAGPSRPTAF